MPYTIPDEMQRLFASLAANAMTAPHSLDFSGDWPIVEALAAEDLTADDEVARLEPLVAALATNTTLQILDLSRNCLDDRAAEQLSIVLATHPTLQELNVAGNHFSDAGIAALAKGLAGNTGLQRLSLGRGKAISKQGLDPLLHVLFENKTLRILQLNNIRAGQEIDCTVLAKMLAANQTLQQLDLTSVFLSDEQLKYLVEQLEHARGLQKLTLDCDNRLGLMARLIGYNTPLHTLRLNAVQFSDVSSAQLVTALKANTKLTVLTMVGLRAQRVSEGFMLSLGAALAENTVLETLELINCGITDDSLALLAKHLSSAKSLRCLNLSHNLIEDIDCLVELLAAASLSHLNINFNYHILIDQQLFLIQCLYQKQSLQSLEMYANYDASRDLNLGHFVNLVNARNAIIARHPRYREFIVQAFAQYTDSTLYPSFIQDMLQATKTAEPLRLGMNIACLFTASGLSHAGHRIVANRCNTITKMRILRELAEAGCCTLATHKKLAGADSAEPPLIERCMLSTL